MVRDEVEWEEGVGEERKQGCTFVLVVAVLVRWRGLVLGSRTKREVVAQAILRNNPLREDTSRRETTAREDTASGAG